MRPILVRIALVLAFVLMWKVAHAEVLAGYDVDKLADAIYLAEGGAGTAHPYGILAKYKHTTPRQACLNTIRHKWRDWVALGSHGDYLVYLAGKYCPVGAANDPMGLNRNWLGNVRKLYVNRTKMASNLPQDAF